MKTRRLLEVMFAIFEGRMQRIAAFKALIFFKIVYSLIIIIIITIMTIIIIIIIIIIINNNNNKVTKKLPK
jgi:hypothetical protein